MLTFLTSVTVTGLVTTVKVAIQPIYVSTEKELRSRPLSDLVWRSLVIVKPRKSPRIEYLTPLIIVQFTQKAKT